MTYYKKICIALSISLGLNIAANDSFAKMTYVLDQSVINSPIHKEINSAMQHAVDAYNTYSDYNIEVPVYYDANVPTANANNNGRIVFGGSYGNKTAIHELGHIMGVGTYGTWWKLLGENSRYLGKHGIAALKELEGEDAILYADKMHFWPHGFNRGYENVEKHIRLIGAMRKDMGLPDRTKTASNPAKQPPVIAVPKILKPKTLVPNIPTLTTPKQKPAYQTVILETVQGKKALDITGNNNLDAAVSNSSTGNKSQQWEMIPTDSGFFALRNKASGLCLDVAGSLKTLNNDALVQWSCHSGYNQQWTKVSVFNKFTTLVNRRSGRCIQRQNSSRANGIPFVQYSCSKKSMGQMLRLR